jgi:hypothetical protein
LDEHHIKRFNFLKYFIEMGMMTSSTQRVADLKHKERVEYDNLLAKYMFERYEENWEESLKSNMEYN